jgi:ribosome-associated translation inhibitor RaiA
VNVEIRTRGFSLTPGLRTYVERRVEFALDRYAERIARVRVTVADVNGPRGGEDKSCRVEVRLRGGRAVRTAVVDADAYAGIGVALHRAGRAVARSLQRERATVLELLWLARAISDRPPSAA